MAHFKYNNKAVFAGIIINYGPQFSIYGPAELTAKGHTIKRALNNYNAQIKQCYYYYNSFSRPCVFLRVICFALFNQIVQILGTKLQILREKWPPYQKTSLCFDFYHSSVNLYFLPWNFVTFKIFLLGIWCKKKKNLKIFTLWQVVTVLSAGVINNFFVLFSLVDRYWFCWFSISFWYFGLVDIITIFRTIEANFF